MTPQENAVLAVVQVEMKALNTNMIAVQADVKTILQQIYTFPQTYVSTTAFNEYKDAQDKKAEALRRINVTRAIQNILIGSAITGLIAFFLTHR